MNSGLEAEAALGGLNHVECPRVTVMNLFLLPEVPDVHTYVLVQNILTHFCQKLPLVLGVLQQEA